jgi:hypothetical protein
MCDRNSLALRNSYRLYELGVMIASTTALQIGILYAPLTNLESGFILKVNNV